MNGLEYDRPKALERAKALAQKGEQADMQHRIDDAIAAYEESLVYSSESIATYERLGRLYLETSQYDAADTVAMTGLSLSDSAQLWALRSSVSQARYDVTNGIAFAQRAIEADIESGYAWYALTTAFGLAGDEFRADEALTDGLALAPNHPELLAESAMAPLNKPGEQVRRLREIVKTYPHNRNESALRWHSPQGDWTASLLEQILDCNPRTMQSEYGCTLQWFEAARSAAAQALSIYGGSFYAHFALFHVAYENWDDIAARDHLDAMHSLCSGTSLHTAFVSQAIELLDGPQDALDLLADYAERWPRATTAKAAMVDIAIRHGQLEDACAMTDTLRAAYPDRYDLFRTACQIRVEMQDAEGALPMLTQIESAAERDYYSLRLQSIEDRDVEQIKADYEAHLENYPGLDYAWGYLFRYAAEHSDEVAVCRMTEGPFRVPAGVRHATLAYVHSNQGRLEETREALDLLLAGSTVPRRWVWALEFALEASMLQVLNPSIKSSCVNLATRRTNRQQEGQRTLWKMDEHIITPQWSPRACPSGDI